METCSEMPRDLQLALLAYTEAKAGLRGVINETEDPAWRNCAQRLLDLPLTVRTSKQSLEDWEQEQLAKTG